MHSELHIRYVLHFLVEYKHLVITIISDLIFLYDIAQSNIIGDGSLAKPICFVVTRHFCLGGHYHCSTVALKSHTAVGFECPCNQFRVAKKSILGLTVRKYDLPEV